MTPEIWTIKEVAEFLRVSVEDVERLVEANAIPYFRVGEKVRFRKDEVNRWASSEPWGESPASGGRHRVASGLTEPTKWILADGGKTLHVFLNRSRDSALNYSLIPVSDAVRDFFPGYKVDFAIETVAGDIVTRVTSAPSGTRVGDPKRGGYVQGGLTQWFRNHRADIETGAHLRICQIQKGIRYRLDLVSGTEVSKTRVA
jgi:excisionase family DNA binding protein